MNQPTNINAEGRTQTIIAYVLLGVLLALYPALLGYRAIVAWIGPEKVVFNSCYYKVVPLNSYSDTKTIEPLDDPSQECITRQEKAHKDGIIEDYKERHRPLRPNQ